MDNIDFKRAGEGIGANEIENVLGKELIQELKKDSKINLKDLK